VAEAASRVRKFHFVGVMDEWESSICLFNMLMTGHRFVLSVQLEHIVPGIRPNLLKRIEKANPASLSKFTENRATRHYNPAQGRGHDDLDMKLFDVALAKYRADVAKYNISHDNCPVSAENPLSRKRSFSRSV
jgi:hypothetical protein